MNRDQSIGGRKVMRPSRLRWFYAQERRVIASGGLSFALGDDFGFKKGLAVCDETHIGAVDC